jgi:hypothetical protein
MPEGQKKTLELMRTPWKPPTNLYELTILSLGPTGHVNPFMDAKVNSSKISDGQYVYKRLANLQTSGTGTFPTSLSEILECSAHPYCNHYSSSISNH